MEIALNTASAADIILLLLIGVGPKIALVPYVEATAKLTSAEQAKVARKMIKTAALVAVILLIFGELLTHLLHFSQAALSIAGGIILLILAVTMVLGRPEGSMQAAPTSRDPLELAVFPLAVPYLLNPAGIVALVVLSAESNTPSALAEVTALLALIFLLDVLVFRWANKVSEKLDAGRMLITEKVFGFLLAALAVQLGITGILAVAANAH